VINTNTTLYYGPACVPVGLFGLSCRTINTASHSPSLSNVEIISYQGNVLYDMNFTYGLNGQPVTHTVWFTNETVFCISPVFGVNELCPVHPVFPVITIATPASSPTNPTNSLRLDLQLSTNSSGGIYVAVDEYNTLSSVNNVTAASDWVIFPCSHSCPFGSPAADLINICNNYAVSYAVYQGNYGIENFTGASPVSINSSARGICPGLPPSAYYEFSPLSETASAPAGVLAPGPTSKNISISNNISGYYTGTTPAQPRVQSLPSRDLHGGGD